MLSSTTKVNLILATTFNGCYSIDGDLPWRHNREDMNHFKNVTSRGRKNAVIMGRKTWESLPKKPLENRLNIVVSHFLIPQDEECVIVETLEEALIKCVIVETLEEALIKCVEEECDNIFVIGGKGLWSEMLKWYWRLIDEIHHTTVYNYIGGKTNLFYDWKRDLPSRVNANLIKRNEFMNVVKTEICIYNLVNNK